MSLGKGDAYETSILGLLLNATPIANIADNAASAPLTNLYIALHTASPEAGTQTTNEATYTGYARVAVARNAGSPKWTVSAGAAYNSEKIQFAICTGGSNTITHFSVGSLSSGAGVVYYCGTVTPNMPVSSGIEPYFDVGELDISED